MRPGRRSCDIGGNWATGMISIRFISQMKKNRETRNGRKLSPRLPIIGRRICSRTNSTPISPRFCTLAGHDLRVGERGPEEADHADGTDQGQQHRLGEAERPDREERREQEGGSRDSSGPGSRSASPKRRGCCPRCIAPRRGSACHRARRFPPASCPRTAPAGAARIQAALVRAERRGMPVLARPACFACRLPMGACRTSRRFRRWRTTSPTSAPTGNSTGICVSHATSQPTRP